MMDHHISHSSLISFHHKWIFQSWITASSCHCLPAQLQSWNRNKQLLMSSVTSWTNVLDGLIDDSFSANYPACTICTELGNINRDTSNRLDHWADSSTHLTGLEGCFMTEFTCRRWGTPSTTANKTLCLSLPALKFQFAVVGKRVNPGLNRTSRCGRHLCGRRARF